MNFRRTLMQAGFLTASAGMLFSATSVKADVDPRLQKMRIEVLAAGQKGAAGMPSLITAMKSPNAMIRRAAVRSLGEIGVPATTILKDAFKNDDDALVRRTALRLLIKLQPKNTVALLKNATADPCDMVRASAVTTLAEMSPRTSQITVLLKEAQDDKSTEVSKIASDALWIFHKASTPLRDKHQFKDHQLAVAKSIELPTEGWKFQRDPGQTGQEDNWYKIDFDDTKWQTIKIGEAWESQIGAKYDGIAWYRRTFTLPSKPAQVGTGIVFDGVDESAWVWINGEYIGQHDVGLTGWDKRFAMDVSDVLQWDAKNQITVRVLDRKMAGGIWKPVHLEVLKR